MDQTQSKLLEHQRNVHLHSAVCNNCQRRELGECRSYISIGGDFYLTNKWTRGCKYHICRMYIFGSVESRDDGSHMASRNDRERFRRGGGGGMRGLTECAFIVLANALCRRMAPVPLRPRRSSISLSMPNTPAISDGDAERLGSVPKSDTAGWLSRVLGTVWIFIIRVSFARRSSITRCRKRSGINNRDKTWPAVRNAWWSISLCSLKQWVCATIAVNYEEKRCVAQYSCVCVCMFTQTRETDIKLSIAALCSWRWIYGFRVTLLKLFRAFCRLGENHFHASRVMPPIRIARWRIASHFTSIHPWF